jgi:adenosylcobinamide-phosphate synthase
MLFAPESVLLSPLVILLAALLIDAVFGEFGPLFRVLPHPVALVGGLTGWCDRRLNRERRGPRTRFVRGLVVTVFIVALAGVAGWLVSEVARTYRYGWIAELALVALLLAQRSLFDHVRAVARALDRDGIAAARTAVSRVVGRDPETLDSHGVSRAAIESLAESFADGVVAPVCWYLVAGLPGLCAYKALNTMDSMIGYRTARHAAFGMTAARLDDVANYIPARIAGLLIVVASLFAPRGRPLSALRVMARDGAKHRSPNAGWPEGAMAGALGVALAGPRSYAGAKENEPWIGGEFSARIGSADIRRALFVYAIACLVTAAIVAAGAGLVLA